MMSGVQLIVDELVGTVGTEKHILDKFYLMGLRYRHTEEYEKVSDMEYYTTVVYKDPITGVSFSADIYHNTEDGMAEITTADIFVG